MKPRWIKRIGHVGLGVPDVERSLDFYTRAANLVLTERGEDGSAYLRCQAEHHCLSLHPAPEPHLDHVGWETLSDEDTEVLAGRLRRAGVAVTEAPPEPGRLGAAYRFRDPEGRRVEVYRASQRVAGIVSPGPFTLKRLAHVTLASRDLAAIERFYRGPLDFRLSDRRPGRGTWLRCNPDHHGVGILAEPRGLIDHHAYEVADWDAIKQICDWMYRQGFPLEAGPMRHGPGNNVNVYVCDPDGLKIEFYCEMELIEDDEDHVRVPAKPWGAPYGNLWLSGRGGEAGGWGS